MSNDQRDPISVTRRPISVTRRTLLQSAAKAAAVSLLPAFPKPALGQGAPFKVGFMLPYTGSNL